MELLHSPQPYLDVIPLSSMPREALLYSKVIFPHIGYLKSIISRNRFNERTCRNLMHAIYYFTDGKRLFQEQFVLVPNFRSKWWVLYHHIRLFIKLGDIAAHKLTFSYFIFFSQLINILL